MLKYRFASLDDFAGLRDNIRQYLGAVCPQEAEMLFVAVNEAVNNAIFHGCAGAQTPSIEISISKQDDEVTVMVAHDGVGYNCSLGRSDEAGAFDEHGRGLSIIGLCTDYHCFDISGKRLEMRKKVV